MDDFRPRDRKTSFRRKGTKRLGFLARRRTRSLTFSTRSRSSSSDARFIRRSGGEAVVRRSGPRFVTCLLASLLIPHNPAAALIEVDVALVQTYALTLEEGASG